MPLRDVRGLQAGAVVTEWTIRLPWPAPPITANQRNHWRKQATLVKAVRTSIHTHISLGQFTGAPWPVMAGHVTVELHYWPRDKRRRDADNLVPTLKSACDGLVDAGVVRDDTPDLMTKVMPILHEPDGDPRVLLIVRQEEK
jgi:crossover junction endodeoxyribonuclease RusA